MEAKPSLPLNYASPKRRLSLSRKEIVRRIAVGMLSLMMIAMGVLLCNSAINALLQSLAPPPHPFDYLDDRAEAALLILGSIVFFAVGIWCGILVVRRPKNPWKVEALAIRPRTDRVQKV